MTSLPARWAALLALTLACAASAQRLDRLQRRLDRRDRLGGVLASGPLLSMALTGNCEGTTPAGLTFSRTSTATCTLATGTLVTLAAGAPRLEAAGLLVEGAATNLALQSEAFDAAAWLKSSATATPDTAIAPDGSESADTIASTSAGGFVQSTGAAAASTSVQGAVYLRAPSGTQAVAVRVYNSTAASQVCLATATVGTAYTRVGCSGTITSGNTVALEVYPGGTGGTGSAYGWGAQLETGPVATSYIPTQGTQVTRQPSVPSSAWPLAGQSPAAWGITVRGSPVGGSWAAGSIFRTLWHVGDGAYGAANTATLYVNATTSRLYFDVYGAVGGLRGFQASLDIAPGPHVVTAAVSSGALSVSVDGTPLAGSVTGTGTGVIDTHPNTLWLGRMGTQDRQFYGHLSNLCVSGPAGGCP